MTDNARKVKNAYAKAWREKNKDKVKEINRRYWEKKAREMEAEETAAGASAPTDPDELTNDVTDKSKEGGAE